MKVALFIRFLGADWFQTFKYSILVFWLGGLGVGWGGYGWDGGMILWYAGFAPPLFLVGALLRFFAFYVQYKTKGDFDEAYSYFAMTSRN